MLSIFEGAPANLVVGALVVGGLALLLAALLGRQVLRRLLRVPRIPRAGLTYALLGALWVGLGVSCAVVALAALMLRDYQRVDGRTPLAEVRCEVVAPGRLRAEVSTPPSAPSERYDIVGDGCVVSLVDVDLRPALRPLGLRELSRVVAVGSLNRRHANPDWLLPEPAGARKLVAVLARGAHQVRVSVPAGAQERLVLVASPSGTVLEQTPI
jgi:hypothetical protein